MAKSPVLVREAVARETAGASCAPVGVRRAAWSQVARVPQRTNIGVDGTYIASRNIARPRESHSGMDMQGREDEAACPRPARNVPPTQFRDLTLLRPARLSRANALQCLPECQRLQRLVQHAHAGIQKLPAQVRSEEHTSE